MNYTYLMKSIILLNLIFSLTVFGGETQKSVLNLECEKMTEENSTYSIEDIGVQISLAKKEMKVELKERALNCTDGCSAQQKILGRYQQIESRALQGRLASITSEFSFPYRSPFLGEGSLRIVKDNTGAFEIRVSIRDRIASSACKEKQTKP